MFKKTEQKMTPVAPSLRRLEEITGVSKATISRFQNGKEVSLSTAQSLYPFLNKCPCCGRKAS